MVNTVRNLRNLISCVELQDWRTTAMNLHIEGSRFCSNHRWSLVMSGSWNTWPSVRNKHTQGPFFTSQILFVMSGSYSAAHLSSRLSGIHLMRYASRQEANTWEIKHNLFINLVVCLTRGPKLLLKRAVHIVRSRASSFIWEYPLLSLSSSSSFLRLLPHLPVTSIPPFIFPSITCCRKQFLRKMWPI
jgi:hypothetical protein